MDERNKYNIYKEEIELAYIQNACVEIELYSIIAPLIRESENGKNLSVRDVSNRKKSKISEPYYGKSGFPDFVLLERNLKAKEPKIYGCIEVKRPNISLDGLPKQIKGHIESFQRVLFTNGIRWRYFHKSVKSSFDITLAEFKDNKFEWKNEDTWDRLLQKIDEIKWI